MAFTVTWSGSDGASGVGSFDVQVCQQGCAEEGAWTDWLSGTTDLAASFLGEDGRTYYFRSRARDRVGNLEGWPAEPDAWTMVDGTAPASWIHPLPAFGPPTFTVTWAGKDTASGVAWYDLQVSPGYQPAPGGWRDWLTRTAATTATFQGVNGQVLLFRSRACDTCGNCAEYPFEAQAFTRVDGSGPRTWFEPTIHEAGEGGFQLAWNGEDDLSGLASYDLYIRDESEADWVPWLRGVTITQSLFTGEAGHAYHFCVRGKDRVGNIEAKECPESWGSWPINGEVVIAVPPTSRVAELPRVAPGNPFQVQWDGQPATAVYDIQVLDLAQGGWEDWLWHTGATAAWFTGESGHTYAFRSRAVDLAGACTEELWPWGYDAVTTVPAGEKQSGPGGPWWGAFCSREGFQQPTPACGRASAF
jgi:hypothetical protein